MQGSFKKISLTTTVTLWGLLFSLSAFVLNGGYDYRFSEITRGMAGAGSALREDSLISATKPAGMVGVGKRMDAGAVIYFPSISYHALSYSPASVPATGIGVAPGFHDSKVPFFFLPDLGVNFHVNHKSSIGISLNLSGQRTDYSAGAGARRFGFLVGLSPKLDLSISYQPRVYMTKFTKYAGLFPNGGEFDYPPFGTVGLVWHATPVLAFVGDVEKIWNQEISNYGNSHDALLNGACITKSATCMSGKDDAGFGWIDSLIYKVGVQWKVTPKTTLRAGFNHSNEILSMQYATENLVTPGALVRNLLTVGASEKISKKDFFNEMIVFIPQQSLTAQNLFSGAANQTVKLSARSLGFGVSWSRILD